MTIAVRESFSVSLSFNAFIMLADFSTADMVKIELLVLRNRYYKANPILKKERFTEEDEVEIKTFLKRTKHPILLKFKKEFDPDEASTSEMADCGKI